MDVLGYSLQEISNVIDSSIPAVKAALNRGRARLRELAQEPDDPLPVLSEPQRSLLNAYVHRFNARDFDAIRDMLADEVRLELVNKTRMNGKAEVGEYFGNYSGSGIRRPTPGDSGTRSPRCLGSADLLRAVGLGWRPAHRHPRFSSRALRNRRRGAADAGLTGWSYLFQRKFKHESTIAFNSQNFIPN
jgi:hypothetical protein